MTFPPLALLIIRAETSLTRYHDRDANVDREVA